MSDPRKNLDEQIRRSLADLETVRDEIRVNLHLAKMDAKDKWNALEPHIEDAKALAREATTAARKKLDDLARRARAVRDAIRASKK
jgi:hypothetical protein